MTRALPAPHEPARDVERATSPPRGATLQPLREPATLLMRPSSLAWTRVAWVVLTAMVGVTLAARLGPWTPWLGAPLLASAAVTSGAWSAAGWALALGLATDLLPPAATQPGGSALPALAAAFVAVRIARWWRSAAWAPALVGACVAAAWHIAVVALAVARTGTFTTAATTSLVSIGTAGVLTALVAPAWVRCSERCRARGRA